MIEGSRRIRTSKPARMHRGAGLELAALGYIAAIIVFAAIVSGCAALGSARTADVLGSHNAAGGYRAACGELPGLLGDDC